MRLLRSFVVFVSALLLAQGFVGSSASVVAQDKVVDKVVDKAVDSLGDVDRPIALHETMADIKAFSKRLDRAEDDLASTDAIVDLSYLYLRVVSDPRFYRSQVLQGNRGRIAAKLQKARRAIEKQARNVDRKSIAGSPQTRHDSGAIEPMAEQSATIIESAVIDKQWLLLAHAAGGTAPSLYHSSGLHGASGHFYRGRAGGLIGDNGGQLLDLIQTIIHPDFWGLNGGPGRAYYYQPLRILVVRATQRVHDDLHSLLLRLRGQL